MSEAIEFVEKYAYQQVRALVAKHGGSMVNKGIGRGCEWRIELEGRFALIQMPNLNANPLDRLYVPKIAAPKYCYDFTSELLPDAFWKLLRLFEQEDALQDMLLNEGLAVQRANDYDDLRTVIEHRGRADQLERFDANVLPQAELDELVCDFLFAPFALPNPPCPLYDEISEQEVAQVCVCPLDHVRFKTRVIERPEIPAGTAWDRYRAVKRAALDAPLAVRDHIGYDGSNPDPDRDEIHRLGVRVTLHFAGADYQREFAL